MAIYKKPTEYKFATLRQGVLWALWGFLAGIYCLQPLMKASHREEKNYLHKIIATDSTTTNGTHSPDKINEKT